MATPRANSYAVASGAGVFAGREGFPAWRAAMVATDTLYRLTTQTHSPPLGSSIVWPGGSRPTRYGNASDSVLIHYSYGSAVWVEDIGTYGAHVYTGTGEDVFSDQMSYIALDADSPVWAWWQQPYYALNSTEAAAQDADWYYDPTAADAVTAIRRITKQPGGYELSASWDQVFPLAIRTDGGGPSGGGWVQVRKAERTMGNNRPLAMRYNAPCYIPPSMTGTGAGAIITNDDAFSGPFIGNNGRPANVGNPSEGRTWNNAPYWADVWPSGNQKLFCRAMNTQTKVWTRLDNAPLDAPTGADTVRNASFVDRTNKRVYYRTGNALYYLDFTAGLAGVTASSYTTMSVTNPGFGGDYSFNAAHCPTEGHPSGRRLMYFVNSTGSSSLNEKNCLRMVDIDNGVVHVLDLYPRGLDFGGRDDLGAGYDPVTNTVYFVGPNVANTAIKYWAFVVPSDPTVAANYTVTSTTLAFASGVTKEAIAYHLHFGRHCQVISSLGVIIWQQKDEAPLAFRVR